VLHPASPLLPWNCTEFQGLSRPLPLPFRALGLRKVIKQHQSKLRRFGQKKNENMPDKLRNEMNETLRDSKLVALNAQAKGERLDKTFTFCSSCRPYRVNLHRYEHSMH
jgi:hypothetical protein